MSIREERRWQHHDAAKKMRKVRRQIKHNREPKRVRHKDWMRVPDGLDDLLEGDTFDAFPQSERIMPRGERERRRALEKVLATLQEELEEEVDADEEGTPGDETEEVMGQRGVVVEVSTGLCRVDLDDRSLVCGIRGSLSAQGRFSRSTIR